MGCEDISDILTEQECKEVLLHFDGNKKFINYKINKYSDTVLGFLAEHYLLSITFLTDEDSSAHCQKFFLKSLPYHNETQKAYIKNMGIFKKEILMYKNLINEFLKLTNKRIAPKYYYSKADQCIVIEDLSSHNFQVCAVEYLDLEKCKSALEALAAFHAASIIFEESKSTNGKPFRINEHFKTEVSEATFSFQEGHVRNMWCKSATNCLGNLSKFFTQRSEIAEKIKEYVFSEDGLRKYLKPSVRYRNVVCHDDLWRNNLLFNDDNECALVDFQLSRYTPPIFDVLLLLYINVERNYLNANFDSLLLLYYNYLVSELSKNDIDVQKIVPKRDFLASVEDYTLPALVESCLYGTNVYLSKEMSNKVTSNMETFEEFSFRNRSPFIMQEFECNENFRRRFCNVLTPLFEAFEKM